MRRMDEHVGVLHAVQRDEVETVACDRDDAAVLLRDGDIVPAYRANLCVRNAFAMMPVVEEKCEILMALQRANTLRLRVQVDREVVTEKLVALCDLEQELLLIGRVFVDGNFAYKGHRDLIATWGYEEASIRDIPGHCQGKQHCEKK